VYLLTYGASANLQLQQATPGTFAIAHQTLQPCNWLLSVECHATWALLLSACKAQEGAAYPFIKGGDVSAVWRSCYSSLAFFASVCSR